jgi:glycerol-3-phosphate dehydrogenase (NAD(P)+)
VALGGGRRRRRGLSGLGDLLLTTTGPGSRNTSLGMEIARGATLAMRWPAASAWRRAWRPRPPSSRAAAEAGVELPICAAVADVLAAATAWARR